MESTTPTISFKEALVFTVLLLTLSAGMLVCSSALEQHLQDLKNTTNSSAGSAGT
jgi:hypothetical protein